VRLPAQTTPQLARKGSDGGDMKKTALDAFWITVCDFLMAEPYPFYGVSIRTDELDAKFWHAENEFQGALLIAEKVTPEAIERVTRLAKEFDAELSTPDYQCESVPILCVPGTPRQHRPVDLELAYKADVDVWLFDGRHFQHQELTWEDIG
jgi:hypothetical protein